MSEPLKVEAEAHRITSYNVCYTKLLRKKPYKHPKVNKAELDYIRQDQEDDEVEGRITSYNVCYTKLLRWDKPYCVDADHINLTNVDRFIGPSDFFTLDVAIYIGNESPADDVAAFKASSYNFV